jgi:hypothetical protein
VTGEFKEPSEDKEPRSVISNPGALCPHHPPAGRRVAELMAALEAGSRFQAGYERASSA